ncbi:uncharacterized protein LOC144365985 [Ictidomys tridecemlineatus]
MEMNLQDQEGTVPTCSGLEKGGSVESRTAESHAHSSGQRSHLVKRYLSHGVDENCADRISSIASDKCSAPRDQLLSSSPRLPWYSHQRSAEWDDRLSWRALYPEIWMKNINANSETQFDFTGRKFCKGVSYPARSENKGPRWSKPIMHQVRNLI